MLGPRAAIVMLLLAGIPSCIRYFRGYSLRILNWEGRFEFRPKEVRHPFTKEQIANILREASDTGRSVTVVGSRHSWSDIAVPEDIMVSLDNYTGVVQIDATNHLITVQGGMTLEAIVTSLEAVGLSLPQLPSVSAQTISGAIATGTHGTGISYGIMATLVTKLEIVSAQGTIYRASEHENHDIFKAALVGLGVLGVITEVTLHCVPAFNLHEVITVIPLEECLANLNDIIHRSDHVKLWFEFHTRLVQVYSANKTTLPTRDGPLSFLLNMRFIIFEYIQYFMSWFPSTTPMIMSILVGLCDALRTGDSIGLPLDVFNIPHYIPPHPELEYAIPLNATADAIRELVTIQEKMKDEISFNIVTEIRFVKGDDIWLSPAYGQDSTFITVMVYNPPEPSLHHYFRQCADDAVKYGGRPHWGKTFYETETELRTRYPKWEDFMAIRKKMDPNQIFKNSYIQRLFHLSQTGPQEK